MVDRQQRLVETLVALADTLVGNFDVVDLFYQLVEVAPDLVGAAEAGLLLGDPEGRLRVMATSSESVRAVELFQAQAEEGPCFDAYSTGEIVTCLLDEPATAERWPRFTRAARAAGFGAVVAIPMRLRDEVIGALNLFRLEPTGLVQEDIIAARALAGIATIAIHQDRAARDSAALVADLQRALDSRVVIEQAKGVIATELGVTMDEAFSRLRRYARNKNRTLRESAGDVVSGDLSPTSLPAG